MTLHTLFVCLAAWSVVSLAFGLVMGRILRKLDTSPDPQDEERSHHPEDHHAAVKPQHKPLPLAR